MEVTELPTALSTGEGSRQADMSPVSTYFSYPEDKQTETAILVLTDFFGNEFINIQLCVDADAKLISWLDRL